MNQKHFAVSRLASQITLLLAASVSWSAIAQTAPAAASTAKPQADIEVMSVRGLRASQAKNLNNKRLAEGTIDSITAEDIGKLPDITIADSLQRVPGIQIRRSAGEGSTVNVRGMPQVTTLLNGEQFLSAGSISDVQPDFTDIPSALMAGMDVLKSPVATTLAGGISGTIDLKTARPFALEQGWTLAGSAEASTGSYSKENDGKYSAFVGYNDEKIAGIFTASYDKSNLANYRFGAPHEGWASAFGEGGGANCTFPCAGGPGRDLNKDGDTNDRYFGFIDYGNMNRFNERDRTGLSASLQADLGQGFELSGDAFYTKMEDAERSQGLVADNAWSDYAWIRPTDLIDRGPSPEGGRLYTSNQVTLDAPRVNAYSESQTNDRDSLNLNLQLAYNNGDAFSGSFRLLHGTAERAHTENVAQGYLTSGAQHSLRRRDANGMEPVNPRGYGPERPQITFDTKGDHPQLTFPKVNGEVFGADINRYNIVSTYSENNFDEEGTLNVARADGNYKFDSEHLQSVDFGVRHGSRDVERNTWIMVAPFTTAGVTKDVMWKDSGQAIADSNGDGDINIATGDLSLGRPWYYTDLPAGWVSQVNNFGPVSGNSIYFVNPKVMDDPFAFQNALYPNNKKLANPNDSYKVDERTQSAYFKANFSSSAGAMSYNANIGVQYIKTELDILQNELGESNCMHCTAPSDAGDITTKRTFNDLLPSANLAVNLTENLIFRSAYGKTMTRLDLGRLGRGLSVGRTRAADRAADLGVSPDTMVAVTATQNGNPQLNPWYSDNIDLGVEYYFGSAGMVSLSVFNLNIDSFIETGSSTIRVKDGDGVERRAVPVTGEVNGKGGTIKGVEFAYQQSFDFLPDFWSGLGAGLNLTYAPSESGAVDFYKATLPIIDNSERSGNAVLWYERSGIQLRIAANYRSERLASNGTVFGLVGKLPIWTEPTTYIDVSGSYDFTDYLTGYASVSNLTEEYENNYLQWEGNVISQNIYERRMTVGIRARF